MEKWRLFLVLMILVSFNVNSQEDSPRISLQGYIKNLHEFSFIDRLDQLQWTSLIHNRLNFEYFPSDEFSIRLEVRNRVYYGDGVRNFPGFSKNLDYDPGLVDLSVNIFDEDKLVFNTLIDRALVNYTKANWDISLGRQRINWGMNLAWNPNDIFNTYNFLDFDYEERPGSDAIRIQYYTGDFSKIELTAKRGEQNDDFIAAGMYKFNKWTYDIQFLTGVYQKDLIIGTGWAGNLKEAGFKGEISYFVPYEEYPGSENVMSASISVDYAFEKGLYVNSSVLYNSSTNNSLSTIEDLILARINAKNLMPFKYSFFIQLSKEFTPIFSGATNFIYSPTRHSVIFMPSLVYSLATNWELNLTGQSFLEFKDYKTLGNSFFLRIRYSF
ncbi:hypothetical protein [Salegentibacter sediminis]|uniref:hypothetical protein n=1 Tax=Salegentibacter sediminis TaxID=1930251 RepID=UPI0012FF93E2|nr:hypothetical protein [Salegentibacter sediminis]